MRLTEGGKYLCAVKKNKQFCCIYLIHFFDLNLGNFENLLNLS